MIGNGQVTRGASLSDGTEHTVTVAPDEGATGEITVTVPAGVARDAHGNPNTASPPFRIALASGWDAQPVSPVTGFTLFDNADGGADVQALTAGAALEALASDRLNIRAETRAGAEIGSVRLELSGTRSSARTENIAPWALFGDRGGEAFPAGSYTVAATPYPEKNLGGTPGSARSVSFTAAAVPVAPTADITGFTLFDHADGGRDVQELTADAALGAQTSDRLNIRADAAPGAAIGSVRLELSGGVTAANTENGAPWYLFGDRGNRGARAFPAGAYTVTATPYPEANLGGAPGQALSVSFTVQAHELSVADARAEEGTDATLGFTVTLSAVSPAPVTVDYATSDGTATAGVDYTATSGTLTFQSGDTSKTISVAVLDDSHDEGEETLTLSLSNASGGRVTDGEATGTIENRDPMPRAFLARFGRTAAVHVVEHVEERIQAQRKPGIQARFAGQELRRDTLDEMALGLLSRLGASVGANRSGAGLQTPVAAGPMDAAAGPEGGLDRREHSGMGLGGGDLLTGSAFVLNHETGRGGVLSFWSRGGRSSFNGREGDLSLDGRVRTTMFGADYAKGPLVMGLSLANSRGRGGYAGVDIGEVVSSVTGLYPWLGYQVTDRLTVWGVTGYGKGALTLTPGEGTALKSGLSMAMAAGGLRGDLADSLVGGFGLAFKADVLWVGTGIEGVEGPAGRLAATDATVTRLRTGLETSRDYSFGRRLSLQPSLEVGLRRDGGDAETGVGADLGGGLIVSDTLSGLSADVRVRMLLAHQDEGFSERGVSLSFSYNPTPSTALGFIARLTPSWGGQATSGAEALWGRETMAGLTDGGLANGNRLDAEVGYGLPVGSRFVGTPKLGLSTSEHGRDYRLGYSLGVLSRESLDFELGIDAQRRENPRQGSADNGFLGRATLRW